MPAKMKKPAAKTKTATTKKAAKATPKSKPAVKTVKSSVKTAPKKIVKAKPAATKASSVKKTTSKAVKATKPAKAAKAVKSAPKKSAPAKSAKTKVAAKIKKVVAKKVAPAKAKAKTPVKKVAAKPKKEPARKASATVSKAAPKKPVKTMKAVATKTKKPTIAKAKKERKVAKEIMSDQPAIENVTVESVGMGFLGIPPYQQKPGEEYMNKQQQVHFRGLLERWKQDLMQEVDRTMHHMKDEAANFPDLSDRASQEEEFNLELRARDRERKLIWKIDEALERLEQDEYGYCDACGIEIGIRRLEARPTATLCIDCKTLDEIREKQTRG